MVLPSIQLSKPENWHSLSLWPTPHQAVLISPPQYLPVQPYLFPMPCHSVQLLKSYPWMTNTNFWPSSHPLQSILQRNWQIYKNANIIIWSVAYSLMSLNGFSLLPYNDQNPELDCIALHGKGLPPVLPISGQCFPTLALHTGFPAPAPQEPY